jgi:hypothetical protein
LVIRYALIHCKGLFMSWWAGLLATLFVSARPWGRRGACPDGGRKLAWPFAWPGAALN